MGFLNIFQSRESSPAAPLPAGSFTVDRTGRMLSATVSSSFPKDKLALIAQAVLQTFRAAQAANLPAEELILHFGSLTLRAREMRGGAMISLSPRTS